MADQIGAVLHIMKHHWKSPVSEAANVPAIRTRFEILRQKVRISYFSRCLAGVKHIESRWDRFVFLWGFFFPSSEFMSTRYIIRNKAMLVLYYVYRPFSLTARLPEAFSAHCGNTPDNWVWMLPLKTPDRGTAAVNLSVPSVECIGLGKDFGPFTPLRDIDLHVEGGTTCAVIGPNGAGKTTLFKILATLVAPTRGKALVCGHDVSGGSRRVRSLIGYVTSDERSFYWRLTGRQNLRFFGALHGVPRTRCDSRIDRLLADLGIDVSGGQAVSRVFHGDEQALSIARGLLHDPRVLLWTNPPAASAMRRPKSFTGSSVPKPNKERSSSFLLMTSSRWTARPTPSSCSGRAQSWGAGTPEEIRRKAGLPAAETLEAAYEALSAGLS